MVFNSFQFLLLFPLIFSVYWLLTFVLQRTRFVAKSSRIGNFLLIAVSYGLYMQWKPEYALVLLGVTAVTYLAARIIEAREAYGCKKYLIFTGTLLALLPLLVFKYTGFVADSIQKLLYGGGGQSVDIQLIAPIGISFYTFQAIGYLFDVYYKRIKAEHNWWDYMLFVCFFPQILSGPISKANDLLPQIKAQREFDYSRSVQACKWLLWGMFMKVVVADRLALYVDPILGNYQYNSGITILLACFFYSFQIYCDFAGYSLLAIGVGSLCGFNLVNNFRQPYLSVSITDFWRRWHISLSTWLKDYVYIPLGGSRCSKARNYWNIFVTFLVSGIWHGANWTFIVWGIWHGVVQIVEKALGIQKCENSSFWVRAPRILVTFVLVMLGWLVFRMPTISDAWQCLVRIFTASGDLLIASRTTFLFCIMGVFMVCVKDLVAEFNLSNRLFFNSSQRWIRWSSYAGTILIILLFGVFDAGQFIYVNF